MTTGFLQMTTGVLAATLACLWSAESGAKSKTCSGRLWVIPPSSFVDVGLPVGKLNSRGIGLIAQIEGRGTCKSSNHGCRKRAADAIIECARDMWAARSSVGLPASCTNTRGNSIVTRVTLEGIFPGFQNTVLEHSRSFVCCSFNKSAAVVPATVFVDVLGKEGCISKDPSNNVFDIISNRDASRHSVAEDAKLQCMKVRQDHCKP